MKRVSCPRNHLYLLCQSPAILAGLSAFRSQAQDRRKLAPEVDAEFAVLGRERDVVDERADDRGRLGVNAGVKLYRLAGVKLHR